MALLGANSSGLIPALRNKIRKATESFENFTCHLDIIDLEIESLLDGD